MRKDILEKKQEILEHIATNGCKSELCRRFKCKPETLNSYLSQMGIEYSGNSSRKGIKSGEGYKPVMYYINNDIYLGASKLRAKLIRDGIKEAKCERCNQREWLNKPIPLELHHIDGNRYNNSLDNLQVLCPNCHAQLTLYMQG